MNAPAAPDQSRRFAGWAAGIALAVAVALAPLVVLQVRQFKLLNDTAQFQRDSVLWIAFQLEREHSRLRAAIEQAVEKHVPLDAAALTLRYDIFLSRKGLLQDNDSIVDLKNSEQYRVAMARLEEFVRRADPVFERLGTGRADLAELRPLLKELNTHDEVLGSLTHRANFAVYAYIDESNRTIRQQGILVISLAAVQALVLLIFVGTLIVYIRRQSRQNQTLQDLNLHLQAARSEAEAAYQGKSVFLANMSHEIRTPFQGLLGMLNLLDESQLSGKQRDYVQTARDSAQHLLGILNDILDVSTMESGTLKLTATPVQLEGVIAEVHALMRVTASEKGLELDLRIEPGVPEWVQADPTRLRQVLFNLINNAIKFTTQGSVKVVVQPRPAGAPGVEISITDSGIGMDEQTVQNLFARFYQADPSVKRRFGGTGLGLEISRNLARMMGGDISVSSQLGVGSTFKVVLPLPNAEPPDYATQPAVLGDRRLRVLAAEDHPINLKFMSILLEKMGHEAVFCENGREALELVRTQPFDVVLMDLHMPEMDGLSATRAIRELDGPASQVKIILVTADVVNDTREKALIAGIDAFAAKPLQIDDLRRALKHCGLMSGVSEESGPPSAPGQFQVSAYEVPVDLPVQRDLQPMNYVDGPVFREIVAMMPDDTLADLLHELFNEPHGAVQGLLDALAAGDRHAIGQAAHKLKGTSMLLGLKAIVKTTAALEHKARQTQDPIPPGTADDLNFDIFQTRQALEALGMPVTRKAEQDSAAIAKMG